MHRQTSGSHPFQRRFDLRFPCLGFCFLEIEEAGVSLIENFSESF
jgi:hypothetical protein